MKELEIVNKALENLAKNIEITGDWNGVAPKDLDGEIDFLINNQHCKLYVEVKKELRNHQLQNIQALALKHKNHFIIVAEKIFPKIKEELRQNEIPYLEANGNIWLKNGKTFLWIDTNKDFNVEKEKINRAFTKTGLKVIFHFLLNDDNVNQTYRDLANITGVGLGNINYVINGLKETGHLLKLNKTKYKLINKKELLEKWMIAYEERLKPTLFMGTFKFMKQEDFANWKHMQFKNENTIWGGEPAGDILTNYLKPAELTIYTEETRVELIKNYRLIPDPVGNIKIYKKFWNENEAGNTAPPLLAYADLLNTRDPRNIETANKIYKNVLQNKL
jgi:hypothetical protein